jgi:drug/metabolite transporter (DMT)-like permease
VAADSLPPPVNRPLEFFLLGLLALFWGSSYLWAKVSLEVVPPFTLIAFRVGIAAVLLTAWVIIRRIPLPTDAHTWWLLLIQAFMNSFGAWCLLAWGLQYVDSSLATVLNSMSPLFVFFITLLFTRHETVNARKFAGAVLGLIGVVLIVGTDALNGLGQQVIAQLAILTGSLLYAGAAIFGKRFAGIPPAATATATMLISTAIVVPFSLVVEQPWDLQPELKHIGAVLMLSVFGTVGALMLYFRLVNTLGSMGVASQGFLRIGVGVLLGTLVLGETITLVIGIGLCAAVTGVVLINWPNRSRK